MIHVEECLTTWYKYRSVSGTWKINRIHGFNRLDTSSWYTIDFQRLKLSRGMMHHVNFMPLKSTHETPMYLYLCTILIYYMISREFLYFSYWTINIHVISILSIYSYFYTSCKKNLYDKKYIYITKISCHFIKFKTKNLSPDLIKFCKEKKIRYNGKFYGFFPYDAVLDPRYFIISWNKKKLV